MAKKKPSRKKPYRKVGRSKKKDMSKFAFKTSIDVLLSGLIAIGVFLGRPANIKPIESYYWMLVFIGFIVFLMAIYSLKYGKPESIFGLLIVLILSIMEVIIIGIIFQESWTSIYITIFIVTPSVIIFDKILNYN